MNEWTAWIEHDGNGLPDQVRGQLAWIADECICEGVRDQVVVAGSEGGESWDWLNYPDVTRVLRYRLRRSPSAQSLIETLRGLPVKQGEDA